MISVLPVRVDNRNEVPCQSASGQAEMRQDPIGDAHPLRAFAPAVDADRRCAYRHPAGRPRRPNARCRQHAAQRTHAISSTDGEQCRVLLPARKAPGEVVRHLVHGHELHAGMC